MLKILATDGIESSAADKLRSMGHQVDIQFYEPEALKKAVNEYDVLIIRSATKIKADIIDASKETGKFKLVIRGGVGIDNIDHVYAESKGVSVRNTPNASSISVAEATIAHMMGTVRFLHNANHTMRNKEWNKKKYEGTEVYKKTLGLVGFGRIAKEVAVRAKALGMNVLYTNRSGAKEGYEDYEYVSFDDLLARADFISLHTPSNADGSPLLGEAEFKKMKPNAVIVNLGRGNLIDEAALVKALDEGVIAGACLDVFTKEPLENEALLHDKISLSPHIGGSTKEAQGRIGEEICSIIEEFAKEA